MSVWESLVLTMFVVWTHQVDTNVRDVSMDMKWHQTLMIATVLVRNYQLWFVLQNTSSLSWLDIDECTNSSICWENSECVNRPGSYVCQCMEGYNYTGEMECLGELFNLNQKHRCPKQMIFCHWVLDPMHLKAVLAKSIPLPWMAISVCCCI